MTRSLAISLVCTSLAACQTTSDTAAAVGTVVDGPICSAAVPPTTLWDEKSLPQLGTARPAVYVSDCLIARNRYFAMLVDGSKIAGVLEVKPDAIGRFLGLAFARPPAVAGSDLESTFDGMPTLSVVKLPCGHPPGLTAAAPPLDGLFPVNLNQAFYTDALAIGDALASGALCPGK